MSNPAPLISPLESTHTSWSGPLTPQGRPELRLGSADPDPADGPVRHLQRLLRDRGYDYVPVNGQFDLLTLAAVKDFQLRFLPAPLDADGETEGVVADRTWQALLTASPEMATALPNQSSLAPCPLGTHLDLPPDLVVVGRSNAAQWLSWQYAHFTPNRETWRTYPFRDDQGQLPQLRLGDADPQGSSDGPIRQLQLFLQDYGYYKGEVNGRFSQELYDVVVAYQNTHPSLLADGVINAADWEQLFRDDRLDVGQSGMFTPAAGTATPIPAGIASQSAATPTQSIPPPLPVDLALVSFDQSFDQSVGSSFERSFDQGAIGPAPTEHPWLRLHAADDEAIANGPIRQLQRLLFVVGFGVPLTGIFDVATEQAVRQFQAQFPDLSDPPGEVGPQTWTRLEQAAAQPLDPWSLLGVFDPGGGVPTAPDPRLYWDEPLPMPATGLPQPALELVNFAPLTPAAPVDFSPLASTPLLQKGQIDTTPNGPIGHLQQLLNEYGYVLTVDGQFNEATYQAVLNFQHSHDLPPTGVVDQPTWEVLMGQDTTDPAQRLPDGAALNPVIPDLAMPNLPVSEPTTPAPAILDLPIPDLAILDLSTPVLAMPSEGVAPDVPLSVTEMTPPAWDALMGQDQGQDSTEPSPLLAVTPPTDLALPAELVELPSAPPAAWDEQTRSPLPDPLIPSETKPLPVQTLVDVYAQGEAVLTASQQQALQWLSQQLPTATLTEFQQRWLSQGSPT